MRSYGSDALFIALGGVALGAILNNSSSRAAIDRIGQQLAATTRELDEARRALNRERELKQEAEQMLANERRLTKENAAVIAKKDSEIANLHQKLLARDRELETLRDAKRLSEPNGKSA